MSRAVPPAPAPSRARRARTAAGIGVTLAALVWLAVAVDPAGLREGADLAVAALGDRPVGLAAALGAYAGAFALRTWAWTAVLPGLSAGQAWAALHVSLAGNHVLPLRLGEPLRVASVVRRTPLPLREVVATAVALRVGDLTGVLLLAALAAPALLAGPAGLVPGRVAAAAGAALVGGGLAALAWVRRLRAGGAAVRLPGPAVAAACLAAWVLESAVVWQAAAAVGVPLSAAEAVAVTAVTIAAQTVAVTPGGVGTYEAAATGALLLTGAEPAPALAVALLTHALKTAYSLVTGTVALVAPAPGWWGRWRLARALPPRPLPSAVAADAPVVAFLPARDEEESVAEVVRRLPASCAGRPVVVLVVDDGSTDATAAEAAAAGARVVGVHPGRGLGAAVRRGLAEAVALGPACVVYLDADGEYPPESLPELAARVLAGEADYVVGSRFATHPSRRRMRPHRRAGNLVLTAWLRWTARRRDLTDGQSGMRAFSPAAAAAAEVVHDYNYAQVLTLDLLGKGFAYAEVPIPYAFRTHGRSFVRLGAYLRRVLPAVHRELNAAPSALDQVGGSVLDDVRGEALARR